MKVILIEDINRDLVNKEVEIKGWLHNQRSSGKIRFLIVRDGTGFIQATLVKNEVDEKTWDIAKELTQESSIIIRGTVKEDKRAPGGFELLLKDIELVNIAKDYPITPKEHGIGFLLRHRHLWLRSRRQNAILRIRNELESSINSFFESRSFIRLDAPILTPTSCEGTTTLFETKYFDEEKAYLSQSGQLYMEAGAMAFGRVYCFGPTFRAEKSKTRRHLTEFWMLEPEVAYFHLDDIIGLAEELIMYLVEQVITRRKEELSILERDISKLEAITSPFPRITYTEAINILKKRGYDIEWGDDFGAPHETELSKGYSSPLIIHRYPTKVKPFYMKIDPENEELVLNMDILAPEGYGEIIGGSEREDDLDSLLRRMKEEGLPIEPFEWYLDLRRYGSVPHSGFGLGLERTIAWICGLSHVRETIPFPRMLYRIYP